MKTLLSTACLLALLLLPVPAWAQLTLLDSTTLNGAITINATTLVLTSASASTGSSFGAPAAGMCLLIDRELMRIASIASTTVTVTRPNGKAAHPTLSVILIGPCAQGTAGGFQANDPPASVLGNSGTCATYALPWVNFNTGNSWWCEVAGNQRGSWSVTNTIPYNATTGGTGVNSGVTVMIGTRRVAQ
jgi:hypothetical protein